MSQIQLSPISVAHHYKAAADFWEEQAKILRHHLDEAEARVGTLEQKVALQGGAAETPAAGPAS